MIACICGGIEFLIVGLLALVLWLLRSFRILPRREYINEEWPNDSFCKPVRKNRKGKR